MEKLSYWKAMGEIERLVKESIPGSHPRNWDVHVLTQRLLSSLRGNLQNAPITGFKREFTIRWETLRRRQKEPAASAAVALLARIAHRDGAFLEGAAFLEPRVKTDGKRTFDSFALPQLRKSLRGSPFTQALLFDYEDITSYANNRSVLFPPMEFSPWRGGLPVTACTYAVVSPMNVVVAQRVNDTSIYRFSVPLSFQFVYRYWHGFDLDVSEPALLSARGFPARRDAPGYLLVMTVVEEGAEAPAEAELDLANWRPFE